MRALAWTCLAVSCALVGGFSGNELKSYAQPRIVRSLQPASRLGRRRFCGRALAEVVPDEPEAGPQASEAEIGNLVADDEYLGLAMELTELVRIAVREELKAKLREFIGKDDYRIGDVSKELDASIKAEVARLRQKEEYELFDLSIALDTLAKDEVKRMTGKPDYAFGDLSIEIDKSVKEAVGKFTGKGTYAPGDLQAEIRRRVAKQVLEFTGKPYAFGDVSREIESRRRAWVRDYLGSDAYQFGDLSKKAVSQLTGKAEGDYQFGDITKTLGSKLFGPRKRKRGD